MAFTNDVVPNDVLEEASRIIMGAQNRVIQQFLQQDLRTGEGYLFILNSDRRLDLIDQLPSGFLIEGGKEGFQPVNGQKISTIRLSDLPYVVFRVVNGNQSATS